MGFLSSLSFLTPVYIAAGLAVGLPVLLHLIRRTPKGRLDFGSVMFLTPAPPRITRRSRIEHWLLLLLRALAVLLIVAAFMRPLWRQLQAQNESTHGRLLVLLLDRSASLQRDGLWTETRDKVREIVETLSVNDQLTVVAFDDQRQVLLSLDEWRELEPAQRAAVLSQRLADLPAGWGPAHLDSALMDAADRLEQAEAGAQDGRARSVIVVSDLSSGSRWQGLQGFEWPRDISVELVRVGAEASRNNAGVAVVGQPQPGDPPFVRVRVSNSANSETEQFQLGWRGAFDDPQSTGPTSGLLPVYVPPGQSRVVRLSRDNADFSSARVALAGDDHSFDNQLQLSWPEPRQIRMVYLGSDDESDRDGLRFFLRPLFADTDERIVSIENQLAEAAAASSSGGSTALVIASGALPDVPGLKSHLAAGGTLLYVLQAGNDGAELSALTNGPPLSISEADVDDYSMLSEVDFSHPIFQPLSDPRYSDLSKVHFWHHRRVDVSGWPAARVLARFDDGDPAWIEVPIEQGRLLLLTSSWTRDDSEMATWSKFVTIMNALLESSAPAEPRVAHAIVGHDLPLTALAARRPPPDHLVLPDGSEQSWAAAVADPVARLPGSYRVQRLTSATDATVPKSTPDSDPPPSPELLATIAVNLPPEESETSPLGVDVLDSLGLRLAGDTEDSPESVRQEEQVARSELESRQKLWKYLLAAALVILLAETLLAGRHAYRDVGPASAG